MCGELWFVRLRSQMKKKKKKKKGMFVCDRGQGSDSYSLSTQFCATKKMRCERERA